METKNAAPAARGGNGAPAEFEENLFFLAHELQAPLRRIGGFAGLLARRAGGDPKERLYAGHIKAGAEQMAGLIDALLRYSRAVAQSAEPVRVDVGRVVESVLDELAPEIRRAGGLARNDAAGQAETDPRKLAAIILELVSNALKFRGARRPVIRVRAEKTGKELVVSVSDNGIGVPPGNGETLFSMFRRLNSGGRFPGAGMGLALCRRLAGQCGGRVWFKSRPGGGSVFYLAVPAGGK